MLRPIYCFLFSIILCIFILGTGNCKAQHQIEISKKNNQLVLYKDGKKQQTYMVATGKITPQAPSGLTPEGTFIIVTKIESPEWTARNLPGGLKVIPGGNPSNPLGSRWIGFSVDGDNGRSYGIHGTIYPKLIGTHASKGCVRMFNKDVEDLFVKIGTGTPVWIHNRDSTGHWKGTGSIPAPISSSSIPLAASSSSLPLAASSSSVPLVASSSSLPSAASSSSLPSAASSSSLPSAASSSSVPLVASSSSLPSAASSSSLPSAASSSSLPLGASSPSLLLAASSSIPLGASSSSMPLVASSSSLPLVASSSSLPLGASSSSVPLVASPVSGSTTSRGKIKITSGHAYIRECPNRTSKVLQKVENNTEITIIDHCVGESINKNSKWFKIRLRNGSTAYIHSSIVTK